MSSTNKEYETEMVRRIGMAMKKEMEIGRAGGREVERGEDGLDEVTWRQRIKEMYRTSRMIDSYSCVFTQ